MTVVIMGWKRKSRITTEAIALSRLEVKEQRGLRQRPQVKHDTAAMMKGMQK